MIRNQGWRHGITVAGVGCTVALMLFLFGLYEGVKRESNGYVTQRAVDVWICHDNSRNLIRSTSFVRSSIMDLAGDTDGVADFAPLLRIIETATIEDREVSLFLLGIQPEAGLTRPIVVAGVDSIESGEIILDRAFAAKHDVAVGDTLRIQYLPYRVAGLSTGTNAMITQFAFVTLPDAQNLIGFDNVVSFGLLTADDGIAPEALIDSLGLIVPELRAFTAAEFIQNNLDEMQTGMLPMLWTVAIFGTAIGTAVLMLMLYGSVLERREDYALLKAIGLGQTAISSIVLRQSFLAGVQGLVIGVVLYLVATPLILTVVPEIALALTWWVVALVGMLATGISILGSLLPIRKVGQVYPGEVFRA